MGDTGGKLSRDSRVAIVGGGPAGLSCALFLQRAGYRHVTVFEQHERVGGKCKSLTFEGRCFDLGANYITSSYREVRRLARRHGMRMFTEKAGHAVNPETGELRSILSATTQGSSLLAVGWAALRYLLIRWRLDPLLSPAAPGFAAASGREELCRPFSAWLDDHGLHALEPVFNIPVTLMGYSRLGEIPAAYALTYMRLGTFINLMMFALDPPWRRWPKRFDRGYERLWERVAETLTVLRGARIERISRGETVQIDYSISGADLLTESGQRRHAEFDALILACPLQAAHLAGFMDLDETEQRLLSQLLVDPFVVATYVTDTKVPVQAVSFSFPQPPLGEPFVVTRQFADSPLVSIYTRVDREGRIGKDEVLANNREFLRRLGATDPDAEPYTYDDWAYFPHVTAEQMLAGFYTELEARQGVNRTYYVGGAMAFELVEPIVAYSRDLVARHFGAV